MARLSGFCLLTVIYLSLAACGFALRGSDALSSRFAHIQLQLQQPNGEFARLLRRSLTVANVETSVLEVGAGDRTLPLLQVANEQVLARPVTVNPRARAAQIELRLSIDIALGQDQQELIAPETLFVERTYFEDIENISGNQREVALITTEMRRELVNQLMRRLQATGDG